MTASEALKQVAVLTAIQKHAGRVKNGRHHFNARQMMDAIIGLADIGIKSIDVDTKRDGDSN